MSGTDKPKNNEEESGVAIYNRINRLREKAGGSRHGSGTGQLDPKVVQQAYKALDTYAPEYPKTVTRDLDKLMAVTQQLLQAGPEQQQPLLRQMSSLANEVQSLGSTFGYDLVTGVGQSLRRFTDQMQHADPSQLVLIRAHVDTIRVVLSRSIKGDGGAEGRALIEELKIALGKHGGETAAQVLEEILSALN